ncbi:MAG: UDP-N-acetylmuramoyl-L-alanine--D-glutamate ligase [Muribaculaceae bacterium]|nr:UDP-N-acetylmuramoyl-L-alanine--D-glutamate ligase [Muribaculaceae bacterium]
MDKRKIVVLGAGESGTGAAILAHDKGMDVFLSEYGTVAPRYAAMLDAEGIGWEQGGHSMDRILAADEIVKSPGIADSTPVMKAVRERGIPVVSEIELAARYFPEGTRTVCITGSNGKTTTTMLTHHILRRAGIDASEAGNIGRSLALQVAREPHDVYVIELSSFQLDNMYDFRADTAIITNITPDHLDRYDYKMENYVAAKMRILQNMRPCDTFISWADDPVVALRSELQATQARRLEFAIGKAADAFIGADGKLMLCGSELMAAAELSLPGDHNRLNSMAAALAASSMGASREAIAEGLRTFAPVEHRLEPAGTVDGVRWINDSKATNVNSCFYALGAMTTPTVLILGGKDKGNDYSEILPMVREKVKAIVAMGLHNEKIVEFFSPYVAVESTHTLADAVTACRRVAAAGDTVLLSPCCASFDLFKSYEDRGRQFKAMVKNLS